MKTDVRTLLAEVDRSPAPDLWEGARQRTPGPIAPESDRRGGRLVAAAVAFVLFVAAGLGVWQAFGRDESPVDAPSPVDRLASLPNGWTKLAPPPDIRCCDAWTGEELLAWGGLDPDVSPSGEEVALDDGYRFDPFTGAIELMSPSPLAARAMAATAWTGSELLVWGGLRSEVDGPFFDDGAAYDPSTDTWRALPDAGLSARVPLSAWTGSKLIVWGTGIRVDDRPIDGAIYDPELDSWRAMADGPIEVTDASAVWTGQEFVVVGAALHGGNFPETPTAIAAAYDPVTDTWRELSPSPLSPNSNVSVWTGDRVVGVDYDHVTAELDPDTGTWTELDGLPGDECEGALGPMQAVQGWVLVEDCGDVSLLVPGATSWQADADAPPSVGRALAAGDVMLASGVASVTGNPQLWGYRPPSTDADVVGPAELDAYLPLYFLQPPDGWHTVDHGPVKDGTVTVAWASTVPIDERDRDPLAPAIPIHTIEDLPADGVVVATQAIPWAYGSGGDPYPSVSLRPLDLSDARVRGRVNEEPPGDYTVHEIPAGYVLVRVYFGSTPDPGQVAGAQALLDTLQIPPVCPVSAVGPLEASASQSEAAPGDMLTLSGPMPFQRPSGSYDRSGSTLVVAWWNADPQSWPELASFSTTSPSPAGPGPLLRLGDGGLGACSYSIAFEVPHMPPGTYHVVLIQEGPMPDPSGAAMMGPPIDITVAPEQ